MMQHDGVMVADTGSDHDHAGDSWLATDCSRECRLPVDGVIQSIQDRDTVEEVIELTDEKAKALRAIAESYVAWRKRSDTPTVAREATCALCVYSGAYGDPDHADCSICPVYIYSDCGCIEDYDYNGYRKQMMSEPIAISRAKLYAEKVANKLLNLWFMVLEDDRRWR